MATYEHDPQKFEKSAREDLAMMATMVAAGFRPQYKHDDILNNRATPHHDVSYKKDEVEVWRAGRAEDKHRWVSSRLVNGRYTDHKKHETLKAFLETIG